MDTDTRNKPSIPHNASARIVTIVVVLVITPIVLLTGTAPAAAELERMSAVEMRSVSGFSLLEFSDYDGSITSGIGNTNLHFARIDINASVNASAKITNARLGNYDDNGDFSNSRYSASGQANDLNINELGVQGSNGDPSSDMSIETPYVSLAFENWGTASQTLVGLRVGAENMDGNLRFDLETFSGSFDVTALGLPDWATNIHVNRHRTTQVEICDPFGIICVNPDFSLGGGLTLSNSKDFWLSVNKKDIIWEHQNPILSGNPGNGGTGFNTDGKGFWIHITDGAEGEF